MGKSQSTVAAERGKNPWFTSEGKKSELKRLIKKKKAQTHTHFESVLVVGVVDSGERESRHAISGRR